MKKLKRCALLLALAVLMALSGCVMMNGADLLMLPELSPDQAELLKLINSVTSGTNWASTNPSGGTNRLTVQYVDFYGDGIPEVVAFFRNSKDVLLRLTVYSKTGDTTYAEMCSIENAGHAFDRVDYVDLNGDAKLELALGISYDTAAVRGLCVYSIKNNIAAELFRGHYSAVSYNDLTGDGTSDVIAFYGSETETGIVAELFASTEDSGGNLRSLGTAPVSRGITQPDFLTAGRLNDRTPVVVAEGRITDGERTTYISDVFSWSEERGFYNLSYAEFYQRSYETQRSVALYFSDPDFDDWLEFPLTVVMQQANAAQTAQQLIRWYSYDADGMVSSDIVTGVSTDEGWYFIYPASWTDEVSAAGMTEENGDRHYIYSCVINGEAVKLLEIISRPAAEDGTAEAPEGAVLLVVSRGREFYAVLPEAYPDTLGAELRLSGITEVRQRFVLITAAGDYKRIASN